MQSSNATERKLAQHYREILRILGLQGHNFEETPERVARFMATLKHTQPYPKIRTFPSDMGQLVILRNHVCHGLCPHHLMPVKYTIKVGYIPNGKVIGLSKLARIPDYFAQFLPLQEDLAEQIVEHLHQLLKPLGVGCQIVGQHSCVQSRGVHSHLAEFITTTLKGVILINPSTHQEFLSS